MKVGKKLKKFFRKRNKKIDQLFKKNARTFSISDFHELRVEIKKIKALFTFIDFCSPHFKWKPSFKPYKIIFAKAGNVRELQLEEKELGNNSARNLLKDYLLHLRKLKIQAQKDFFENITADLKESIENSFDKIKPFLSKTNKKKASIYLEKKGRQIEKLSGKKILKTNKLHEFRKHLKTFGYTRTMLDKNLPDKKLNRSENFQELLGKWHDKEIINSHLEKVIKSNKIKPAELKQLRRIRGKNLIEGKALLKQINRAMHIGGSKVMQ